ncbi:MAG: SusC/RagA family TonB-linked outer membrane protein [Methanococcaceae archaeon]
MKKLLLILLLLCSRSIYGQDIEQLNITLPTNDLSIDSLLSVMRTQQDLVFSYSNNLPLNTKIHFDSTHLSVLQIIDSICAQAGLHYKIKGRKIMLYLKKIQKSYLYGVVTEQRSGESISGVVVQIKGTNYVTSTNEEGNYRLYVDDGMYNLTYSMIGHELDERRITLNEDTQLDVSLKESNFYIDEVRITRQRNFWRNLEVGRNISTIYSKKIESLNTNNAAGILQASIPGVWSTQTSGAPGDHQKVKIRGINSIFGCTDPLYIIDGVAVPIVNLHSLGIADLNIHDIETITVLKDASSTAIYGYQGGNGVVIIDTKRANEKHISFSTKFGIQRLPKKLDLMNTKDFLSALDTASVKKNSNIRRYYPAYNDSLCSNDGQDAVFQDGVVNEYQLSGSGKLGKTNYFISGDYWNHEGIIVHSNYKKYTASAKLSRNIGQKLSLELSSRNSLQLNKNNLDLFNGNDLLIESINKSPLLACTPDSFYQTPFPYISKKYGSQMTDVNRTYYDYFYSDGRSKTPADSIMSATDNTLQIVSHTFDLRAKYLLSENLFINASSSVTLRNQQYKTEDETVASYYSTDDKFMSENENYTLLNQQINLNYEKSIKTHEFQLSAGYRNYLDKAEWQISSKNKHPHSSNQQNFMKLSLAINSEHGTTLRQIQSFSGVLNYNYSQKYFLSLVTNYESLSVAKTIHYNAVYPSASFKWDLSREKPLNAIHWLDELSVYANWGRAGNMPLNALATDMYTNYRYNYGDTLVNGRAITQFANHYLKPEMIEESNLGATLGLFKNRLRLKGDYYTKISKDLIMIRDIPYYYGGGRMMINIAKVTNEGREMNMDLDIIDTRNVQWSSSFGIFTNKLLINDIGEEDQLEFYNNDLLIPQFEIKKNEELGVIMGYQYLGDYTAEDKTNKDKRYANAGGGKYLNADTIDVKFNEKDMIKLGKTLPDYTWHWQNSFTFKTISLDFLWYGVMGVSKYNGTKAATFIGATNRETLLVMSKTNKSLTNKIFYQSSYFVEDASFIRLKQVTLAYSFQKKLFKIADMSLALSFENFVTLTKYTGYDPEATIATDNSFSDYAVDRGAYPNPKSVYLTLKLDL